MRTTTPIPGPKPNPVQRIHNALERVRKAHQNLINQNVSLFIIAMEYRSLYGPLRPEEKLLNLEKEKEKPPQKKDFRALAESFFLAG